MPPRLPFPARRSYQESQAANHPPRPPSAAPRKRRPVRPLSLVPEIPVQQADLLVPGQQYRDRPGELGLSLRRGKKTRKPAFLEVGASKFRLYRRLDHNHVWRVASFICRQQRAEKQRRALGPPVDRTPK